MKAAKLLIITTVVFGLLLGGALTLQTRANTVTVQARISPPYHSLEDPIPLYFMITLSNFPNPYKPEQVDPTSVEVDGVPMAEIEDWPKIGKKTYKFKVSGEALMYGVVLPYIYHEGFPPHTRVPMELTVTGQFISEVPFQGTCTLTVFTEKEELDPNPGPEPPP